jgi:hypothetical protein
MRIATHAGRRDIWLKTMASLQRMKNALEAMVNLLYVIRHSLDYPSTAAIYLNMADKVLADMVEMRPRDWAGRGLVQECADHLYEIFGIGCFDNLICCLYRSVAPHPNHGQYLYFGLTATARPMSSRVRSSENGVAEDQEIVWTGFNRFRRGGGIHGADVPLASRKQECASLRQRLVFSHYQDGSSHLFHFSNVEGLI